MDFINISSDFPFNSHVRIIIPDIVIHARSSPIFNTNAIPDIQYLRDCGYISRPLLENEHKKLLKLQYCIEKITFKSNPDSVYVSVFPNGNTIQELGFEYSNGCDISKKHAIRTILTGLVIRKNCTIGRNSSSLNILIETVFDENRKETLTDVCINSNTNIFIKNDNVNQSSISKPRIMDLDLLDEYPGMNESFKQILELLMYPILYPKLILHLNIDCPRGVLLHGPPGCGKTRLVMQVAKACNASLVNIQGPEIYSSTIGESEERLRSKFNEANAQAKLGNPCILFIDELDALTPNRNNSSGQESRIVAQMLTLMDGLKKRDQVVVIAATNRPNSIDPALRRPGRFDREISIEVPSEAIRLQILQSITKKISLFSDDILSNISRITSGYVPADLVSLCREASMIAAYSERNVVTMDDFKLALTKCGGPSVKRGYNLSLETLDWSCLGGMEDVKMKLDRVISWPLLHVNTFKRMGLNPSRGILLYGPPGCSKTTIAKIVAATSNASFFSLNGAQIFSAFVGDSEKIVRELFSKARLSSPSIIFLDEVETIVGKRNIGSQGQNDPVRDRILSTLLNEMDGIESAKGILVIGATNRPDMIDDALLRPGRFDKAIHVREPNALAREQIFKIYTSKMPLDSDIDFKVLSGDQTDGFTGADIKSLCREAAFEAVKRSKYGNVQMCDFESALKFTCPTVNNDMKLLYHELSKRFGDN